MKEKIVEILKRYDTYPMLTDWSKNHETNAEEILSLLNKIWSNTTFKCGLMTCCDFKGENNICETSLYCKYKKITNE